MKKNQLLITQSAVLLSALIISFTVFAEQDKPQKKGKASPKDRFEMMATKLKLDEKQKTALKPMLERLKREQQETLKELDEKQTKELSTILGPDQVKHVKRSIKRGQRNKGRKEFQGKKHSKKGVYPKPPAKLPNQ